MTETLIYWECEGCGVETHEIISAGMLPVEVSCSICGTLNKVVRNVELKAYKLILQKSKEKEGKGVTE